MSITVLTTTYHLSLSWAWSFQYKSFHTISWKSTLILPSHLRLCLQSELFPSTFPHLSIVRTSSLPSTCYMSQPSHSSWYYHPRSTVWFKKIDSISYVYISWTIHGMWIVYITSEGGGLNFQISPLERSPNAQPCSSVSWEQNGYYAAQDFAFTQTAYLLKSVIPKTNALPRWRLNVETKTKRTLYRAEKVSTKLRTIWDGKGINRSKQVTQWWQTKRGSWCTNGVILRNIRLTIFVPENH